MPIVFDQQWISNDFVRAVCWTLIHSLWLGLAAALLAAVMIFCTRRSAALLRYNLLCGIFILFLLSAAFSFIYEFRLASDQDTSSLPISSTITIKDIGGTEPVRAASSGMESLTRTFIQYFDRNAPLVVLAWFIIFSFHCLKLLGGIYRVENLRNRKVKPVAEQWQEKLQELSALLGIGTPVLLLQSELVRLPVVLGYFKPTILVPLGFLINLPPEQVETVLLHELAHIRRKDYIVNLLQSMAESVFFFNPAAKWLSALIREEREACCDDIVVASTSDKENYLQALVSFHELSLQNSGYAMAIGSHRHALLNRVRRLLTYENNKLNIMEKLFLASGLMVFTAFGIAGSEGDHAKTGTPAPAEIKIEKPVASTVRKLMTDQRGLKQRNNSGVREQAALSKKILDTVPRSSKNFTHVRTNINNDGTTWTKDMVVEDENGKTYRIRKTNSGITDFYVNDVRIPESEMANYKTVLDEIAVLEKEQEQRAAKRREEAQQRREQAQLRREQLDLKRKDLRAKLDLQREERANVLSVERGRKALRVDDSSRRQLINKMTDQRLREEKTRLQTNEHRNVLREERNKQSLNLNQKRQELMNRTQNLNRDRVRLVNRLPNNEVSRIIDELSRENLIDNTENLSFSLDKNELVVNGKKQSSDLHNKLKERFIHKDGDLIKYSRNGNTTTTTINRD